MKINLIDLRAKILQTLSRNLTVEQSEMVCDYLIWAEMSGKKTQGVLKLAGPEPLQDVARDGDLVIERETKLSLRINAMKNPAPLVASIGTSTAITKAVEHGFGIVGIHNTFSSNGAQAYYVEQIAQHGLIGIMMSRSPGSVAPFNSIDPLFGTNPIGFAFPTSGEPLVFDCATSAMTWYGLVLAKSRGESIPDNMAIDSEGNPTMDPSVAMSGALLPFDRSFKGSGFGMIVEIMAGPLVSSSFCDYKTFDQEWGTVILAIDPELLVYREVFKQQCSDLVTMIEGSRSKDGSKIRVPGQQARKSYQESKDSGFVDIDESVLSELGWL